MNEVAVIRRNADDSRGTLDAIRAAFPETVDVHGWEHVRIDRVDSNGQLTAYLADLPMDELRAVFLLGAPGHGKPQPSRQEQYIHLEREQSLLAALVACRHTRIVNRGAALAWNRALHEGPAQLRRLARLGWRTPSVTQSFELDGDGVSKLREPDAEPWEQDLLVIGLRRHARATQAQTPGLEPLIARTQLHMREHALDVVTIPIAMTSDGVIAFGFHAGVSTDIPREQLVRLLQEAVE